MADQQVTVQFGAKTDEIDSGSQHVQEKLQQLQQQTNDAADAFTRFGDSVKSASDTAVSSVGDVSKEFEKLHESLGKGADANSGIFDLIAKVASKLGPVGIAIAGVTAAAGGAYLAAYKLEQSIAAIGDRADRVGVSAERLQNLQQAFALGGVKAKDFETDIVKISDQLRDLNWDKDGKFSKQLDEWGIKARTLPGYFDDVSKTLKKAADEGGGPLVAKVAEALHVSDQLAKVLALGPAELKRLEQAAAAAGATIKNDVVEQAKANIKAWDDATSTIELRIKGWLSSMGLAVLNWARQIKPIIIDAFTSWMKGAQENYEDTLSKMTVSNRFGEDFGANFGDQASSAMDKLKARFGEIKESITVTDNAIKDTGKDLSKIADDWKFIDDKGKSKLDTTEMTGLREELDAIRAKYAELKETEQDDIVTFKKTEAEKVSELKAALNERLTATNAVFAQELAAAADNKNKQAQIERAYAKEVENIHKEMNRLTLEADKKNMQEWQSDIQGIASAFNSQLSGLLAHTTTWGQAMANVGRQVVLKLIEEFEKLLIIQPLLRMISGAGIPSPQSAIGGAVSGAGGAAGGAAAGGLFAPLLTALGLQTSATTASTAASAANTSASVAGTTASAANTTAMAASDTVTTANTIAQGSNTISVLANTVATQLNTIVEGIKSFLPSYDVGTNYVPQTGLALVHQGEAIIPAGYNTSGLGGGGGFQPSGGVNFQVQALDSAGVQAFFTRYGPQIAKLLSQHMNQNPSYGL